MDEYTKAALEYLVKLLDAPIPKEFQLRAAQLILEASRFGQTREAEKRETCAEQVGHGSASD